MLLAVDIGNSRTGFGLFPRARTGRGLRMHTVPSLPAAVSRYRSVIDDLIGAAQVRDAPGRRHAAPVGAVVSSVVPSAAEAVMRALRRVVTETPLAVDASVRSGLIFAVKHPEQLGADRITNAVAAVNLCGCPVAVADLGTATTVTVVGRGQVLLGGAILPGLTLMRTALCRGTAQLPEIVLRKPRTALGSDTASAILSGITYGTAGAIERIIAGIEKAHRFKVHLVLTGGHAHLISPLLGRSHVTRPMLIFEGLRLIYLRHLAHIREDITS